MTYSTTTDAIQQALKKTPIRYRFLAWLIVKAIKNGEYVWLLGKVVGYIALYIKIDHENKTWSLTSERIDHPEWGKVDYTDIDYIFKSKPAGYHTTETHYPDGRFKSFSVSTF